MEEIITDSNCITKAFESFRIVVLNETAEDKTITYWFRASDFEKTIGMQNIRASIQNYTAKEKGIKEIETTKGKQRAVFLTSRGVYRLLYSSKMPLAEQFRDWVGDILDDIIFNHGFELKRQLESSHQRMLEAATKSAADKHSLLLELGHKKRVVYVASIGGKLVKFGVTDDLKRRVTEHQRDFETFFLLYVIECNNNRALETCLKREHPIIQRKQTLEVNGHTHTEIIELDDSYGEEQLRATLQNLKQLSDRETTQSEQQHEIEMKRLDVEDKRLKVEHMRIQLELERTRHGLQSAEAQLLVSPPAVLTPAEESIQSSLPALVETPMVPAPTTTEPVLASSSSEVKPLSILPNAKVTNMEQFYQTWVTQYKQQYLEHKQAHESYQWVEAFGKQAAHQAKQRYHKVEPFLTFLDGEANPEQTLAWLNAIATERSIDPNRFVKFIFRKALKPVLNCPCMKSRGACSCKGDSQFLRTKLIEFGAPL
jgi:prophage antirepressor-like protein